MFEPMGEARPLPFPLQNQVSNENEVDVAGLPVQSFEWPVDSTERVLFPLYISLDEYVALSSAIDVGSDIAYPLQTLQIMWIWMTQPKGPIVSICDQIAACIADNEATKQALREFLASDSAGREIIGNISRNGNPANPTETLVTTTNDDALFGAVTFLIDTMHEANLDLYEAIEASSNAREQGQVVFEAIPLIETLPFDEVSEYIDQLVSAVAENYAAQWTTTPITGMRDRLRCALFCMAKDNDGTLTWEMIANYFWSEVAYTPVEYVELLFDFVNFFGSGTWDGDEIVLISFANIASVLSTTQKFAEMTFPSLKGIMGLGLNNPDPDWEIVCEDCPEPPVDPIIEVIPAYATWTGNPEFLSNEDGGSWWRLTFTTAEGITAITVTTLVEGEPACVFVADGTGNATSYQHAFCGGGLTSGSGIGANPALAVGPSLGWYGVDGNTIDVLLKT